MLSKVFTRLFSTSTVPNVWVNKYTKVICQGITGNQVSPLSFRELFRHNKPLIMEHKWSEVSILKKQDRHILDYLSSKIVVKLKMEQEPMLP